MMHAWELLRELSHPARLDIVRGVAVQAKPVEVLADQVNASVQETTMNLDRLGKFGLVEKNQDGLYRTAPMGQVVLWLLPAVDFLATHSDFFRDQELSLLPPRFVSRLGDLSGGERMDGAVSNIQNAERIFERAEERIWVVANEVMLDAVPVVREKIAKGADFRFIIDQSFKAPPAFEPTRPELWRQISKVPASVVITEKEGMVFFLDRELMVDYSVAFTSDESHFMMWCEDLIETLWREGVPLK
jgi:predicted transcriptional regulator